MRSLVIMFCAALLGGCVSNSDDPCEGVERRGRRTANSVFCWRSGGIPPDPVLGKKWTLPFGSWVARKLAWYCRPEHLYLAGRSGEYRGVVPTTCRPVACLNRVAMAGLINQPAVSSEILRERSSCRRGTHLPYVSAAAAGTGNPCHWRRHICHTRIWFAYNLAQRLEIGDSRRRHSATASADDLKATSSTVNKRVRGRTLPLLLLIPMALVKMSCASPSCPSPDQQFVDLGFALLAQLFPVHQDLICVRPVLRQSGGMMSRSGVVLLQQLEVGSVRGHQLHRHRT